ncbi:MAG: hypothetical protein ABFD96_00500 [Armatimonadia bacterium]
MRKAYLLLVMAVASCGGAVAETKPYVGSFWNTRMYHVADGPCVGVISGFKVDFENEDAAVNSGYVPCTFCVPKPGRVYLDKEKRVRQAEAAFERQLQAAADEWARNTFAAGSMYELAGGAADLSILANADSQFSLSEAMQFNALAMVDPERARRQFGDRFIASDASEGFMIAALRLQREAMRREIAAAMALNYAIQYTVATAQAMDKLHASEVAVEWAAIQKSVKKRLAEQDYRMAAVTASFGILVAPETPEETKKAKDLQVEALKAFAEKAPWSAAEEQGTLNLAWEAGTHGHPLYGVAILNLVTVKNPDAPRRAQIYNEILHARW